MYDMFNQDPENRKPKVELIIDTLEYQSVFKVFDPEKTGRITIQQVNSYIQKFEEAQSAASRAEEEAGKASNQPKG